MGKPGGSAHRAVGARKSSCARGRPWWGGSVEAQVRPQLRQRWASTASGAEGIRTEPNWDS